MRKPSFALLLLVLAAGPLRADGLRAGLELSSSWLAADDDVVASVTIENASTRTILVPRWLVPGERLDANLFAVTRGGEPVAYLGRLVKRAAPAGADFVTLAPGETLRGSTELTKHYDMGDGGEYLVAFRMNLLDGIGAGELSEKVESNAVAVWRDGSSSGPRPAWSASPAVEPALTTPNCSVSEASAAATAVTNAKNMATGARDYLMGRTWSTVGQRYTTWFGAPDSGRFNTVSNHYVAIRNALQNAPLAINCDCDEPYYAYVYPNQPYDIWVCNAFWSAPATGTDSKAGTLIHEISHYNVVAGTDDHDYGQSGCMTLANNSPNLAIDNADSHEYFAENTPPLEGGGGGGNAGSIRFGQGTRSVDESAGTISMTVKRVNGSSGAVSVHYQTANGSASSPGDYGSVSGNLNWANGDSSDKSFNVAIVNDSASEGDETFSASLSAPTGGATLGSPSSSTVTIVDGDCTPSVCVPNANTLCLAGGSGTPNRFRVRVTWTDFEGDSGPGVALAYTADSGFFYFFNPQILELLVKIVNGCGANGAYWFYYGSTTNVALHYTVEDLLACETRTLDVPLGQFASNGDINFFDQSCP